MTPNAAYGLVVFFDLQPGSEDRFDVLASTLQTAARREPGTHVYEIHRVDGASTQRCFYERYADEAAFRQHEQSPALKAFFADCTPLLARPPSITVLR